MTTASAIEPCNLPRDNRCGSPARVVLWYLIVCVFWAPWSHASDHRAGDYAAASIPPSLLRNVDAVVRRDSTHFVVDGSRTVMVVLHAVTILNPEGRQFGEVHLSYDAFRTIEDLEGDLYDADGEHIRSLEESDIQDFAAIPSYSLYEESRVRTAGLYHGRYPYTVVFTYEISDEAAINWPDWEPEYNRASVERTSFTVRLSGTDTLRWWSNAGLRPRVASVAGGTIYRWESTSLQPIELEKMGPPDGDQYARVKIAPHMFEVDGHVGDLSTWNAFGRWIHALCEGRQELSPQLRMEITTLTDSVADTRERVARIYRLMQRRTRYVNVTLGIGGWQPFPASYVEERKYGDCKALTNFMRSLLKAAGIQSFPALVYAGSQPRWLVQEFPHNCFNHMILCVPMPHDTIWLECTSPSAPFAHLGAWTENRPVLVVTPEGGFLRRTPQSSPADNMQLRDASVTITAEGDGIATIKTRYTGNQQDRIRGILGDASPHERETWLREDINIPAATLRSSDFSDVGGSNLRLNIHFLVDIRRYATLAGQRLLFTPNLMEKRTYVPPADTIRKQPIIEWYPYLDIDTVVYDLPKSFAVEVLPKPVNIVTPFARYESSVSSARPRELVYVRRLEVIATEVPPSEYEQYRAFWIEVVKADKAAASLVRQ